jgi:hypothetical protein
LLDEHPVSDFLDEQSVKEPLDVLQGVLQEVLVDEEFPVEHSSYSEDELHFLLHSVKQSSSDDSQSDVEV